MRGFFGGPCKGVVKHIQDGHLAWQNQLWKRVMKAIKLTKLALKSVKEAYDERPPQKALNGIVLHMHYRHKIWSKGPWTDLRQTLKPTKLDPKSDFKAWKIEPLRKANDASKENEGWEGHLSMISKLKTSSKPLKIPWISVAKRPK